MTWVVATGTLDWPPIRCWQYRFLLRVIRARSTNAAPWKWGNWPTCKSHFTILKAGNYWSDYVKFTNWKKVICVNFDHWNWSITTINSISPKLQMYLQLAGKILYESIFYKCCLSTKIVLYTYEDIHIGTHNGVEWSISWNTKFSGTGTQSG